MKNHILFSHRNWKQELRLEIERQNELREEAITAEYSRATAAEERLHKEIQAESSANIDAFEKVQSQFEEHLSDEENTRKEINAAITAEKNRATNAEELLHAEIQAESSANIDAFTKVQSQFEEHLLDEENTRKEINTAITAERTRATAIENNLQNNITAEKNRATNAEELLHAEIQAESSANIDAFTKVQSQFEEYILTAENDNKEIKKSIAKETARATAVEAELETRKADEEGFFPKMTSGFSNNLAGRGESVETELIFRPTGGIYSIEDGVAHIEKIKGNSIVWNQAAEIKDNFSDNDVTFTSDGKGSYSLSTPVEISATANTAFEIAKIENAAGHKILVYGSPATSDGTNYCLMSEDGYKETGEGIIFSSTIDTVRISIYVFKGNVINSTVKFKPQVFDLTRIFGAGNEPATIKEFRKLFPEEYYAYNPGEIRSFMAEEIVTTGFNQWDEEWEKGAISGNNNIINDKVIRCKNFIPIIQGYDYFLKSPYGIYISCYNINKTFIGNYQTDNAGRTAPNSKILYSLMPSGTAFIRFYSVTEYGNVYNNDICINISHSGYRNGEYEAHEKFTRKLPIAKYFPDGMRSAGVIHDELSAHEAITRIGVREYAAGDETNTAVTTDGTTTCYALSEPIITKTDASLNFDYEVYDFGTEEIIGNKTPLKANIAYGFNAVDTIRNNRLNLDELTGSLENAFADTLTGTADKLKKAFDFSNITIIDTPPTFVPKNDGLYIDAVNLKLYIAANSLWVIVNLEEHYITTAE